MASQNNLRNRLCSHPLEHRRPARHHRPRAGAEVEVFCHSAGKWLDGTITEMLAENRVNVEFSLGSIRCRKAVDINSEDLMLASGSDESAIDEFDPNGFFSSILFFELDGYKPVRVNGIREEMFEHPTNGIRMLDRAFEVCDSRPGEILLYHYTSEAAYKSIYGGRDMKLFATLLETCANPYDTCFGDGVYATSKSPDQFLSKDDVLINNYTNSDDPEKEYDFRKIHQGKADYCIPLMVPRDMAFNIWQDLIPGFNKLGIMRELTPGVERPVRADRDIWVIRSEAADKAIAPSSHQMASLNEKCSMVFRTLVDAGRPEALAAATHLSQFIEFTRATEKFECQELRHQFDQLLMEHGVCLPEGTKVQIHNLTSPEGLKLNGRFGIAKCFQKTKEEGGLIAPRAEVILKDGSKKAIKTRYLDFFSKHSAEFRPISREIDQFIGEQEFFIGCLAKGTFVGT